MEGDSRELSDHVVVDDQAHWNPSNEKVELHLFDYIALHVGLHCRSHHVVRWVHHHEARQEICALVIDP